MVSVKRFEVEIHLPDVFRLERGYFQLEGDKTGQFAVVKKQVYKEVGIPYLHTEFLPDKSKVPPDFKQEFFHVCDYSLLQA
jgi:hypothetical protein